MNLTGSWYDPNTNGSGLVIDDFETGCIVYWYSYTTGFSNLKEGQMWLLGQQVTGYSFELFRPTGRWGTDAGFNVGEPVGELILTPQENGTLHGKYRFFRLATCQRVMVSPTWSGCAGSFDLQRLTPPRSV